MRIAELLLRSRRRRRHTMSLETLLEAAKYLEYRTEANARGEDPQDFVTFLTCSSGGGGGGSHGGHHNRSTFSPSANGHIDCLLEVEPKERRRTSGCVSRALGTREVHNKLEKNRRAHLKRCFESLKKQIPIMDEKKSSNLGVLRSSLRYIQLLKRKEREYEFETERLAKEKIALQQRLTSLKKELSARHDVDVNCLLMDVAANVPAAVAAATEDTNSTSTATECGPLSDFEDDEFLDEEASIDNMSSSKAPPPDSVSKVRRTATELFRLLCDPPLSVQSLETQGPYIMCCQQTAAKSVAPPAVATKVTREPSSNASATVAAISGQTGSAAAVQPTATFIVQPTHRVSGEPAAAMTEQGPAALTFGSGIPSRVQMAPLSFPAQIVSQAANLHFNGSAAAAGILTSGHHPQPIQLLAQPTMRFIATPAATTTTTNKQPVNGPHQPSAAAAGTKGQMVKVTAANGQSQIAIAQLAIKPATLNVGGATLNFRPTIGVKGTTSSMTQIAHLMSATSSNAPSHVQQQHNVLDGSSGVVGSGKMMSIGTHNLPRTTAINHLMPLQFLSAPPSQQMVKPVVVVTAPPTSSSSASKDLAVTGSNSSSSASTKKTYPAYGKDTKQ